MHGLGTVGAAAPLRPGSRALRTPARSTFPSYWSEGGDGGSNSWAGSWIAASGGRAHLGARTWRRGAARGFTTPWILDCAGSSQTGQKPAASIPGTHTLTQPGTLRPPEPAYVRGGSASWRPDLEPQQGDRAFPEQTKSEARSPDLRFIAPEQGQAVCTSLRPGRRPAPSHPQLQLPGGSLGCCSSARGGARSLRLPAPPCPGSGSFSHRAGLQGPVRLLKS